MVVKMTSSILDRWYSPGAIRYSPIQIRYFILPFLYELQIGQWPPRPRESGYTTAIIKPPRIQTYQAGFVQAVEVSAELTARMAQLPPPAAAALLAIYGRGEDYQDYARAHNITGYGLRQLLKGAIDYCAGEERKMQSYSAWQAARGVEKLARAMQSPAPGRKNAVAA